MKRNMKQDKKPLMTQISRILLLLVMMTAGATERGDRTILERTILVVLAIIRPTQLPTFISALQKDGVTIKPPMTSQE